MERMRIVTDNTKVNENLLNRVKELEEENKKLRDYADNLDSENDNQAIEIEELEKENKKLKSDLAETQKIGESWRQECKQLREDVDYRHHRCMVAERGGEDDY